MVKEYDDYLEDVEATAGTALHTITNNVQDETLSVLKDLALNVSTDRENLANLSEANLTLQTLATTLQMTLSKVEGQLKTISSWLTVLEGNKATNNNKVHLG